MTKDAATNDAHKVADVKCSEDAHSVFGLQGLSDESIEQAGRSAALLERRLARLEEALQLPPLD